MNAVNTRYLKLKIKLEGNFQKKIAKNVIGMERFTITRKITL